MMKFLLIDETCNSLLMARRLSADVDNVAHVYILAANVDQVVWGGERISIVNHDHWTLDGIIDFVRQHAIDMVVNLNVILANAGLVERCLEKGIRCIGTNQAFAEMESNKREFKSWLHSNDIKTPRILFEGMYEDIIQQANSLAYPCVIKPDSQIGPVVSVCQSAKELMAYLEMTAARIPYARTGIIFMVEEYIPSSHVMAVLYYLCGDKAYMAESVRILFSEKSDKNIDGGMYTVSPYPDFHQYRDQVQMILDKMTEFSSSALGDLQCLIDESGELYVMENSSRPSPYDFLCTEGVYDLLLSLEEKDGSKIPEAALKYNFTREGGKMVAFSLLHQTEKLQVDVDGLNDLPWLEYFPFSVTAEDGKFYSHHRRLASIALVCDESYEQAVGKINDNFSSLQALGDFQSINFEADL